MRKCKSGVVSKILKIVMELAQYYTVFNYRPSRPQKDLNSQDITIVAWPGMKPEPRYVLAGNSKEKVGKDPLPPHPRCVDNG